ncbi:MAG: hypothetical protein K1X77_11735, partial [Bacteroidia bacterium]|nr:hypothetical protein [Bacteroidia bacterium]
MRSHWLVFTLFMLSTTLQAQVGGRFYNWYFGNKAGVNFSGGPPVAVTNGQLVTTEGCAAISDPAGNLLFYTDGVTVWNKNHLVMTNGTGLTGHASSTQSAVIVQKPLNSNIYYIFTADADASANGIRYSEVNLSLSGGLGAITINKNVPLVAPSCEKVVAVRHCNNRDIWIVTHDWNTNGFRTWLVSPAGISGTPVVSNSGSVISGINQSKYGQLKTNNNGNKILAAHYGYTTGGINKVELHDFNNSTGVVSGGFLLSNETGVYGCEFSPNGRVAYAATNGGNLIQYNLCAGTNAAISASRTLIASLGPFIGSLQIGPDNKIYVSRNSTSLSVINNPNTLGAGCGFVNAAIPLSGRNSGLGLPNMAALYNRPPIPPYTFNANCLTVNFTSPTVSPLNNSCSSTGSAINSVSWNFGDPISGLSNTSTQLNPTHVFSSIGAYQVQLILDLGCYKDTLLQTVNVTGFNLTMSSTATPCGASTGTATATPALPGTYTYLWSNGATGQTITGLAAGVYNVTVTASNGCTAIGSVNVPGGTNLNVITNTTNISCFGGSNGAATATP